MICPDCKGSKTITAAHVLYANGRSEYGVPMTCMRCGGSGEVDDRMAEWIRIGRDMRDRRVFGQQGYSTLRQEAIRRGMSMSELSQMEMGKIEPKP